MLGSFVAGRYSAAITYPAVSAKSLGIMEEGYRIGWRYFKDVIRKTDAYGHSPIEAFHLGLEVFISGVAKEWLEGVLRTIAIGTTWMGTGAGQNFNLGVIGRADTDNAGALVLTATALTPAAASPATLTAALCHQVEEDDPNLLFGPEHRTMPYRFRVYPYDNAGTIRFFSST